MAQFWYTTADAPAIRGTIEASDLPAALLRSGPPARR